LATYGPDEFANDFNVSRETLSQFVCYADLLTKWQEKINLVGPKTLSETWKRHFADSAQLYAHAPDKWSAWLDFGSGAGFPGLVIALLSNDPGRHVHLVESNGKKAAFLREAIRATGAAATVHHQRMESLAPFSVDVLSARACASLADLLDYAAPFLLGQPVMLFPKGQDVEDELTSCSKCWNIDLDKFSSQTDPGGVILRIRKAVRVQ
jgi:16S rRNA (guanine527-N7)-methyltransferase